MFAAALKIWRDVPHEQGEDDIVPDSIWFQMLWDCILDTAVENDGTEVLTQHDACEIATRVYNHRVLHKFLVADYVCNTPRRRT